MPCLYTLVVWLSCFCLFLFVLQPFTLLNPVLLIVNVSGKMFIDRCIRLLQTTKHPKHMYARGACGESLMTTIVKYSDTAVQLHCIIQRIRNILENERNITDALNNATNERGYTPLTYAIELKKINVARALLLEGCNANLQGADGHRPLEMSLHVNFAFAEKLIQDYDAAIILRPQHRPVATQFFITRVLSAFWRGFARKDAEIARAFFPYINCTPKVLSAALTCGACNTSAGRTFLLEMCTAIGITFHKYPGSTIRAIENGCSLPIQLNCTTKHTTSSKLADQCMHLFDRGFEFGTCVMHLVAHRPSLLDGAISRWENHNNRCRRQYRRVFVRTEYASKQKMDTCPNGLLRFFRRYPGLRKLVGDIIVRYYTPVDAVQFIDARDDKGYTPLYCALLGGNLALARKLLIVYNADATATPYDTAEKTPMDICLDMYARQMTNSELDSDLETSSSDTDEDEQYDTYKHQQSVATIQNMASLLYSRGGRLRTMLITQVPPGISGLPEGSVFYNAVPCVRDLMHDLKKGRFFPRIIRSRDALGAGRLRTLCNCVHHAAACKCHNLPAHIYCHVCRIQRGEMVTTDACGNYP